MTAILRLRSLLCSGCTSTRTSAGLHPARVESEEHMYATINTMWPPIADMEDEVQEMSRKRGRIILIGSVGAWAQGSNYP